MQSVHTGPAVGLLAQTLLLAALAASVGLSALGWTVGLVTGLFTAVALSRGLRNSGAQRLGPADWVTLARVTLIGGVAALVAQSLTAPISTTVLVALSVCALLLDLVDGWVARRTDTASELGARFDGEADAFLILVLSVYASGIVGWWVLAIGAIRYVYLVAGWVLPWLRRRLPPRYWRKVVAAIQGIVLTVIAADVLPLVASELLALVALGLLAESFGRDIWWQWCRRHEPTSVDAAMAQSQEHAPSPEVHRLG